MAWMATSATGSKRLARDAGVSLVEAMVALMIIGLIVGAVVLLAPGPGRETRTEAERLAARIAFAREESVIVNRTIALNLTPEGYGFERLESNGWAPAEHGSPLGFRAWPAALDVRVEQSASEAQDARIARFDALGGATPVSVIFDGSGARWRVAVTAEGEVDVALAE
ncbi:MAG: GspH/FimT family pseudopilin [Hyphomonadaceae bacterium]|nr:GspH/FimT family pseudopilin [Hyphomonadaceae bacterium]